MRLAYCLAAIMLAGCSGPAAEPDALMRCPIGDPAAPLEMEVEHIDSNLNIVPTTEGAMVPLHPPPQGGWILLLGVRARNLDGCQLTLTTSFKDPGSSQIIKVDRRPARLMDTGDGWGLSTVSTFGNLPVCPQLTSTRNLYDQPYDVTVEIEDIDGKTASKTMALTPTCPDAPLCRCECDRDYVLGTVCPTVAPAGAPPAPPAAAAVSGRRRSAR